jgi:basic membrane protein A
MTSEQPENVYSMFYSTNELSFLSGACAALITNSDMELANEESIVGFLGGMDIPGINDFLVGYIEGAKYINPDIKMFISYAGDFGDPAKGKELSLVQYNSGADVIFNVAGGTGLGIIDAAKEVNKYAIGVDSDQAMLFEDTDKEKASHIVTSAVKYIDKAILRAVEMHVEGTLPYGTHEEMGVKEGGVGLAENNYYNSMLSEENKSKINEIKEKMIAGEITVHSAFGMSTEEIDAIRDSVKVGE